MQSFWTFGQAARGHTHARGRLCGQGVPRGPEQTTRGGVTNNIHERICVILKLLDALESFGAHRVDGTARRSCGRELPAFRTCLCRTVLDSGHQDDTVTLDRIMKNPLKDASAKPKIERSYQTAAACARRVKC